MGCSAGFFCGRGYTNFISAFKILRKGVLLGDRGPLGYYHTRTARSCRVPTGSANVSDEKKSSYPHQADHTNRSTTVTTLHTPCAASRSHKLPTRSVHSTAHSVYVLHRRCDLVKDSHGAEPGSLLCALIPPGLPTAPLSVIT